MRLERFRFRAMGSPCEFKLWAESRNAAAAVANACGREIDRLERKFSRYRDDSLATRINRSAGDPARPTVRISVRTEDQRHPQPSSWQLENHRGA